MITRQIGHTADRTSYRWIVVAVVEASIVAWGVLALADPEILGAGFETHTGETWEGFVGREVAAADFMTIAFRLVGALNVVAGLLLFSVAISGLRKGDPWAWWTVLIGTTLAIGAPIVYDRAVGFIGTFEALEYVALLTVYLALAASWRSRRESGVSSTNRPPADLRSRT